MWQAEHVKARLESYHDDVTVKFLAMTTRGDKILDSPLAKIGGKGLFVKELEQALLSGQADIAVHSMKDVPMHFPQGLCLGPILSREDPRDAFVSNHYQSLDDLPSGAVVGTSSLRRQCQLQRYRPDLVIHSLRGNVNTRLAKLDSGEFDGIILAAAGLIRLAMPSRISSFIDSQICLPACGQGAVGIELRCDDADTHALVAPLHDSATASCIKAERAMNLALNGGCQVPIGGFVELARDGLTLNMRGLVGSVDGEQMLRAEGSAKIANGEQLGHDIAQQLLAMGADAILADVYHGQ